MGNSCPGSPPIRGTRHLAGGALPAVAAARRSAANSAGMATWRLICPATARA